MPVERVNVMDETGQDRMTFVGPYLEGQTLAFSCIAVGGNSIVYYGSGSDYRSRATLGK